MKLKRTKLAALAMTALMAVGAMSLAAYAEEADTPAVAATYYTFDSISFASDGTVTLTYVGDDDTTKTETATATVYKTTDADCGNDGTTIYSYTTTIDGEAKTYYSEAFVTSTATGKHSYSSTTDVVDKATCGTDGTGIRTYTCTVCGDTYKETVVLEATGDHTYTSTSYVYVSNTQKGSDGTPELVDITKNGVYQIVATCTTCGQYIVIDTVTIPAETVAYAMITDTTNIYALPTAAQGKIPVTDFATVFPIANDSIELIDCSSNGYYYITYYTSDGAVYSVSTKQTVTAHHMEVVMVEFASAADAAQCTVTYNSDGTYTIKNNSCYQTITYYEVTHCIATNCANTSACKCGLATCTTKTELLDSTTAAKHANYSTLVKVSSETKTVAPTGDHSISEEVQDAIATVVAGKDSTYADTYAGLYAMINTKKDSNGVAYSKYVKLTNNTSTCTTDGTVTVQYICKICGEVVETETVAVKAPGHKKASTATTENYVASTCYSTGSFETVYYCANASLYGCTYEYSRTTTLLPRTAHTNEESVDVNGVGEDDTDDSKLATNVKVVFVGDVVVDPGDGDYLDLVGSTITVSDSCITVTETVNGQKTTVPYTSLGYSKTLGVYAYAASYCDVCGYEVIIAATPVSIKIDSVTQEKSDGTAGSITLTATYKRTVGSTGKTSTFTQTQTFKYFSSTLAYAGRTENDPVNGLHLDDDGVFRYYVNDEVDYTFSGIVTYQGGQFFVANGVLCSDANGLNLYNGTWYYLSQGQVQTQFTGLAEYDGSYFYIVKGVLSTTVNGLVEIDGSKFLVAEGRLINDYNGLYLDFDGKWYFLALGQLQDFTGVTYYDGAFFKLVNGVLDDSFTGTIEYDGATFNVVAGQLYDQVA